MVPDWYYAFKKLRPDENRLLTKFDFNSIMLYGSNSFVKTWGQFSMVSKDGRQKVEIITIARNYHIEVNPSDVGIYDRVVIQELLKTVAQTQQLDSHTQREFIVVVLMEVDKLTKDAQNALRQTMEKYMATCRIILCCNSSSKVIPAIRSRCLGVRVAAPSVKVITSILQNICRKECLSLPAELAQRIAEKSNRNLRRAILM
ncbi:replication factor C subunit 3 [Caerostris extrusa]|uniref:Replication factor C subunit 3 n=1 Tax=Caerostris extrusa TaxID=172846 RepID=A0AAV4X1Z0_CAEEX|nr:replication factor C subunit 3 [Caerostris extrusa]